MSQSARRHGTGILWKFLSVHTGPLSKHTNRLRHVQLQCQLRSEGHIWTTAVLYSLSVFYLKGNEGVTGEAGDLA